MMDYNWDDERDFYKRMGWCSCPECDRMFWNWQEFKEHADKCVYGEQGINMRKQKFDWCVR